MFVCWLDVKLLDKVITCHMLCLQTVPTLIHSTQVQDKSIPDQNPGCTSSIFFLDSGFLPPCWAAAGASKSCRNPHRKTKSRKTRHGPLLKFTLITEGGNGAPNTDKSLCASVHEPVLTCNLDKNVSLEMALSVISLSFTFQIIRWSCRISLMMQLHQHQCLPAELQRSITDTDWLVCRVASWRSKQQLPAVR